MLRAIRIILKDLFASSKAICFPIPIIIIDMNLPSDAPVISAHEPTPYFFDKFFDGLNKFL